jgi:polyisoprenoid-binding protein YceI
LFFAALALALAGAPSLAAADTTWTIDPGHTTPTFTVRHLVITNVTGRIPLAQGVIVTATGSTLPLSISATLDPTKIDSGNDNRDSDLRGPDYFDTSKFPTITFKSTKIVAGSNGEFAATGDLTIRGITKSVTLNVKTLGTVTDGRGRLHVGYEATTKIDRRDFGMTVLSANGGALVAGTDVNLTLGIEAIARPS